MHASLLLALPLLAPALAHTIPRGYQAHAVRAGIATPPAPRDVSDNATKRSIPKAHFGFPPSSKDIEGAAGFHKRDGMRRVRRRKSKRACAVKEDPLAVSSGSPSASSTVGGVLNAYPTPSAAITSASAVAASADASPASSSVSSHVAEPSASSGAGSSGLSGLMSYVFPRGTGSAHWTTVTEQSDTLSFDDALKPLAAGKLPSAGSAPDGSQALIANYPAGTVKLSAPGHGYSFYTQGQHNGVEVTGAKEVVFSYSVYFQEGFQFVKGGKLPGLYGGTSFETAKSCSGGRQDGRDECFSARLMWRADGAGEIYNYLPTAAYDHGNYCSTPPFSKCDPAFGESIGRGAFTFPTGQWTTVAIRLKMNDANVANGEQELFVNGQSVISLTDLMISVNSETKIYGIMAQTFFGGSDSSWASPIDQSAYFKDWSMAVLA